MYVLVTKSTISSAVPFTAIINGSKTKQWLQYNNMYFSFVSARGIAQFVLV